MQRELFTTIGSDDYNAGLIFGLFIGVFYMFGFIYFIYKKFLSIIFEDLICLLDGKENEETYRPIVYSVLNSIQFVVLCFFSTFSSQSDLGIAAIIGSDCFNTFFVLAVIFIKFKDSNHGILDPWITFRDTFIYLLGLLSMLMFMQENFVNLWSAIILIVYYLINYLVLSGNQDIKEKVMEWIGLNNEDNEFNSDEHFQCRKRRESSSYLKDQGCFDPLDPNLNKKLNRMEALLILKFGQEDPKRKLIYTRFQKSVYQIVFAIQNLGKQEKQRRSERYRAMYNNKPKREMSNNYQDGDEANKDVKREASIKSGNNNEPQQDQDSHPLIDRDSNPDKDNHQEEEHNPQDDNRQQNGQSVAQVNEDSYQDGGISLKFPKTLEEKIIFIIFFPVHLILYLLPNYLENPIPKKLVLCFFLNVILLSGCMFLIDWWLLEISIGANIPIEILGIIFGGIFLSIHFMEYNYKVAREEKQLEFVQSFFQIGICKISLCPAIPWIFKVIVKLNLTISLPFRFGFIISIAIFMGIIFVFVLLSIFKRFKLGAEEGVKMGVFYLVFIVASTVLISLNS